MTSRPQRTASRKPKMEESEFDWWVKQDITPYIGKTVAVANHEIFCGESSVEVYKKARAKYPDKIPMISFVPHPDEVFLL